MSSLSELLVVLMCHISAEPEKGYSEDEKDDIKIDSWQTLIHDLSGPEKSMVKEAIGRQLAQLNTQPNKSHEQLDLVAILDAYLNDELQ